MSLAEFWLKTMNATAADKMQWGRQIQSIS